MKIMIAGGTGFIGEFLVSQLKSAGHELLLLSRRERTSHDPAIRYLKWDGETPGAWTVELETADAVINLSGEPIAAKRWSLQQKERIVQSRVLAARALVNALAKSVHRPKVLINASAVGYYGNVPDGEVTETSPKGTGFLAETCHQWEREALKAKVSGVRTVLLRIGIVLGKNGGALSKMIPPFQFFAGGPLGSGRQWFPWIHREDVVRIILFALENESLSGPVNVTSPHPVSMRDFCRGLGKIMKRPSWAPVPAFALKILLGEMSEMLLEGQKAVPQKLLNQGFVFRFPDLNDALTDVLLLQNPFSALR